MAKLKNPLASLAASGGLGKALTFLRRRRQDIVESTPIPDDPKTLAQLSWRHMYTKAVALWAGLSPAEKQEWESLARGRHMTGFAWFMSQALKPNPGLYLPLQGGTMQGDIAMDSHRILNLTDPTLDQEPATKAYTDEFIGKDLLTTLGDMLVRGAEVPERLPIGDDDKVLTVVAGEPAWATGPTGNTKGRVDILLPAYSSIGQGAWIVVAPGTTHWLGLWTNSSVANLDNISYAIYLDKGTYTLGMMSQTSTNQGIADIDINAAEVASFDLYSSPAIRNVWNTQAAISIVTAGRKTLKLRVHGKNAGSSGYKIAVNSVSLWRTA